MPTSVIPGLVLLCRTDQTLHGKIRPGPIIVRALNFGRYWFAVTCTRLGTPQLMFGTQLHTNGSAYIVPHTTTIHVHVIGMKTHTIHPLIHLYYMYVYVTNGDR